MHMFRNRFVVSVILGVLVLLLLSVAARSARTSTAPTYGPAGPGDVYLALGDSLAWGFRLEQPAAQSFPALLHARLRETQAIEYVNLAVPGATSRSLLGDQLETAVRLIRQERAAGRLVSPITLSIGGNDLQMAERADHSRRAAIVAAAGANVRQALADLRRAAGPEADIALLAYYNPYGGDPAVIDSEAYWVGQLNAALREAAAAHGATVADAYTPFARGGAYAYTYILIGDVHANAEGHAVLAEQFWQALQYDTLSFQHSDHRQETD